MALTLTVTPGAYNANSYVSLADANTILEGFISALVSAWDDATDAQKNAALAQATRQIDNLRLSGRKYNYEYNEGDGEDYQALHFPTVDDVDSDGDPYIPNAVERATALQAAYLLRAGEANQQTADAMNAGITSRGTGKYSENMNVRRMRTICPEAMMELKPWHITSIRVDRG